MQIKAITIKPDYSAALNNLGVLHRDIGQWSNATSYYKRAIEADPFYSEAYYNMGNALREGGALSEAVEHYQKAIELNPKYSSAYRLALSMEAFPVTEEIIARLKSLWRGGEISGTALSELGFALYLCFKRSNKNKEAFDYLLRANSNQRSIDKYDVDQDRKLFRHLKAISPNWLDLRLSDANCRHYLYSLLVCLDLGLRWSSRFYRATAKLRASASCLFVKNTRHYSLSRRFTGPQGKP